MKLFCGMSTLFYVILHQYVAANNVPTIPCNEAWCSGVTKEYPNILYAMLGYNIFKASPFTSGVDRDEGFSEALIFNPSEKSTGNQFKLHSGFEMKNRSEARICAGSSYQLLTTTTNYRQAMLSYYMLFSKDKFTVLNSEIRNILNDSIKAVDLPTPDDLFVANNEYKENKRFFIDTQGVIVNNQYHVCLEYIAKLDDENNTVPLSQAMIDILTEMNNTSTMQEKETVFNKFIRKFGTHYMLQTTFGSKAGFVRRYSLDEIRKVNESGLDKCNNESYFVTWHRGNPDFTSRPECDKISTNNTVDGLPREKVILIGTNSTNPNEWRSQTKFAPFTLTPSPILNLFQERYASLNGTIEYKTILRWFAPMYLNYTSTMKNQDIKTGQDRCGVSDTCRRYIQNCVNGQGIRRNQCDCLNGLTGYDCKTPKHENKNKNNKGGKLISSLTPVFTTLFFILLVLSGN